MTSSIQTSVDQAVKAGNRGLLLEFLQAVADGLKRVSPQTSQKEEVKVVQQSSFPELEKSVREKAKAYITAQGERGHLLFTHKILEPAVGGFNKAASGHVFKI